MGAHSCGPSRSACPRSSIFPSCSVLQCSCTNFFSFPLVLAFLFCIPMLLQLLVQWVGQVWLVPNAATWGYYHGAGVRPDYPLSLTTNGGQTWVTECTVYCRRVESRATYVLYAAVSLFAFKGIIRFKHGNGVILLCWW